MPDRRTFLASTAVAAALASMGSASAAQMQALKFGKRTVFSFDALVAYARKSAQSAYRPAPAPPAEILDRIDYAAHGQIAFKAERALFADGPGKFPVTFFHVGRFFRVPVQMHVVERGSGGATSRPVMYSVDDFQIPAGNPARDMPAGNAFAGFRLHESRQGDQAKLDWRKNDWVAFLGASYFRAIGELYQYGLSARGIALDIAMPDRPEEFPDFTHIYFETPRDGSDVVTVYALLDGPSIVGAFRFDMRRDKSVTMDIDASLFVRRDIGRLGIAPLTSMYWYSETKTSAMADWRPEVHDSDGLAVWNGAGEYLWRPLNNPPRTMVSSFADQNPHGFGLLQRDRVFGHYLDGVHYERRPSLWVEPLDGLGKGSVQLVEIQTDDEIHDNVVAMWVPEQPAVKGSAYRLKYRLHWTDTEPFAPSLARCTATRMGNGGRPGEPRPQGVRKFMVEFLGGPLATLPKGTLPEAVLWASRGKFSYVFTEAVPDDVPGHWRAQFDLDVDGEDPVEMRLYLKLGNDPLSETWLYQYHPNRNPAR